MKKIKAIIFSLGLVLGLVAVPLLVVSSEAHAQANPTQEISNGVKAIGGGDPGPGAFNAQVKNVINTLLFILGIAAVIAIILGGFRYVTANGDAGAVKTAKDIILYACIGLVVAILAFAIVNFVISSFSSTNTR